MLSAPSISYVLLSPMLIVFAAAVLGVLIEAFMGKTHRAAVQLTVSIGALLLALLQCWVQKILQYQQLFLADSF